MWKVNAGRRSAFASEFLEDSVVAIGWSEAGDYTQLRTRSELLAQLAHAYPDRTERQNEVAAGQIWRFLHEVKVGDAVITYDPSDRLYHLGEIAGTATYAPAQSPSLPVRRQVKWSGAVSRDILSPAALGRLGALLTLFKVEVKTAEEIKRLAQARDDVPRPIAPAMAHEEVSDPYADLEEQAVERIKDRLLALDWDEMQEMVASLLRALGYRTIVSPAGPDRGKDIVASKDGFGFEPPRIVVEVKHRRGAMGAPEIRAFLGGRHEQDKGLYVSTGGFTREAHFEAERASTVTHLMTLDDLAVALIANYEALDERGRKLLPLVKVYWPM